MPEVSEAAPSAAALQRKVVAGFVVLVGLFEFVELLRFGLRFGGSGHALLAAVCFGVAHVVSRTPVGDAVWLAGRFRWAWIISAIAFTSFWFARHSVYELAASVLSPQADRTLQSEFSVAVSTAVSLATLLVTCPWFAAEAWALLCECLGAGSARRLSTWFGVASGAAVLLALSVASEVASRFLTPLHGF